MIQNVILKELITLMGTTIVDLDIEIKMKIGRIKFLESKKNNNINTKLIHFYLMRILSTDLCSALKNSALTPTFSVSNKMI